MRLRVLAGEWLLRLLGATWKIDWEGLEHEAAARRQSPGSNVILAFWHGSLLMLAFTHRRRFIRVLVSLHRDGEWIARVLAAMGHALVRGSSRRGGVEALFQLATELEAGHDIAITVDGPIGPRYRVHPGVVILARRTGRPILPMVPSPSRGRRLRTWDELWVPGIGAGVRVRYLEPIFIAAETTSAELAAWQQRVEAAMRAGSRDEETRRGRDIDFDDVIDRRSYWERSSEAARPPLGLRILAQAHAAGRGVERTLRPRPRGRGRLPWVIGVGNLEAGGTGKTPCVVTLARALVARGASVAVLTRGHGGATGGAPEFVGRDNWAAASDETRLLAAALEGAVPVLASRDKARGLEWLRGAHRFDIVVVDDAFQTAGLAVDRHLVLLDAVRPLGNGWLLPAGRLRESPRALHRADALLFTRASGAEVPRHLAWRHLEEKSFRAVEVAVGLRRLDGQPQPAAALAGTGVALLSGLGRPLAFESLARAWGARHDIRVRRAVRVGDHAPLDAALERLGSQLAGLGCQHVVITAKDAHRLDPGRERHEPLLVFEQRLEILDLSRLLEVLQPAVASYSSSA